MVTETYARVEDLVEILDEYPDDTVDEADLQFALEMGHQEMESRVGRTFIHETFMRKVDENGDLVNEVKLPFKPVLFIDEILRENNIQVPEDKYTLDKENGTISFDQTYLDDKLGRDTYLKIELVPEIFERIEFNWALQMLKNQEVVQFEDDQVISLERNARMQAKRLENNVNKVSGPGKATDGKVARGFK